MYKIKIPLIETLITILLALTACGGYEKVDQRTRPDGAQAKAKKNIAEGRGASIGGITRELEEERRMSLALLIPCGEPH